MDCPDAIMGQEESSSKDICSEDEDGDKIVLRTVALPGDLISKFLDVAKVNSDQNIKTVGTLGGRLLVCNNKLCVTHLIIPKQTGHSDSCTLEDEEDVWKVHEKENIIFLGWIHTHPEYSVYLSGVDMHNQYERQRMLPEVSQFAALSISES